MFMELLETIHFKETDTLYVLGDVLDRGPHPIKVLRKLMEMPNAICMVGNHELMALECLEFLMKEITDMSIEELDEEMLDNLVTWQYNGSKSTIDEFSELSSDEKQDVIDFIIEDYSLHELVWIRADYDEQYFEDTFVITGHTPTQTIEDNPRPGFIYRNNNHIAIDCGAHYLGGRLAAICLETGEEYYSSPNEREVFII